MSGRDITPCIRNQYLSLVVYTFSNVMTVKNNVTYMWQVLAFSHKIMQFQGSLVSSDRF